MNHSKIYPDPALTVSFHGKPLAANKNSNQCFEIQHLKAKCFKQSHSIDRRYKKDVYEIMWVKQGCGYFHCRNLRQKIHENNVYLINSGCNYTFESDTPFEGYLISFSEDFFTLSSLDTLQIFHSNSQADCIFPQIYADLETELELEGIFLNILKEYANYFQLRSEALKVYLRILMIYLSRKVDTKTGSEKNDQNNYLLKKFMLLLENNFSVKKSVSSYASDLAITPNHLNAKIKKVTGFTASHHINQRITFEAKRYAIHSTMNMKEVAYLLGFDDTSHFSKFFKKNSGSCFSNFKKHAESIL